jgi:hypothetical protein
MCGTYRLDPSHWTLPSVSEHNTTVSAATDLLTSFRQFFPTTAADKQKHINTIQKLTAILCNNPQQREEITGPPRVAVVSPPRVARIITSSHIPMCLHTLQTTPRIHLHQTQRNTPMPEVMKVEEPPLYVNPPTAPDQN